MNSMKTSKEGLEFISRWEGIALHPYMDMSSLWTIGVRHIILPEEQFSCMTNQKVKELLSSRDPDHPCSELLITHDEALKILANDLILIEAALADGIRVPLNQSQFDAMISFGFNCGVHVYKNSGVCKALNAGDYESIPQRLMDWSTIRIKGELKVNKGLLSRREAEGKFFSKEPIVPEDPHDVPTIMWWNREILMDTQVRLKMLGMYYGVVDGKLNDELLDSVKKFSSAFKVSCGECPQLGVPLAWFGRLAEETT